MQYFPVPTNVCVCIFLRWYLECCKLFQSVNQFEKCLLDMECHIEFHIIYMLRILSRTDNLHLNTFYLAFG